MPPAARAVNFSRACFDLMRQRILHAHVERELHARIGIAQALVEAEFETGNAIAVRVGRADHLHGGKALGVIAFERGLEIEAGQAQMHHARLCIGRKLAGDEHIIARAGEDAGKALPARAGGGGKIARGFAPVPERMRARIKIGDRQIARQQFAIAVHNIGARDKRLRTRERFRAVAFEERDIDKAQTHQPEGHDAERGGYRDASLEDRALRPCDQFPIWMAARRMRESCGLIGAVALALRTG